MNQSSLIEQNKTHNSIQDYTFHFIRYFKYFGICLRINL
jgi:hypothetical protein